MVGLERSTLVWGEEVRVGQRDLASVGEVAYATLAYSSVAYGLVISTSPPKRAAVVGGSLAGLGAAVALERLGFDVAVYEQASRPLTSAGAGIVLQPEVETLLRDFEVVDPDILATSCTERRFLQRDGSTETAWAQPQRFTAWNAVHRHLRSAVADERHHAGRRVVGIDDGEDVATLRFSDGDERDAELVVAADGWDSAIRRVLLPEVDIRYAGYVAWRGVAEEGEVPEELRNVFTDRFTYYEQPQGGHCLCYLVPGADGELEAGRRRLNWVWYVAAAQGPELDLQLTDADGERRRLSIGPGSASAAFVAQVRARAPEVLPRVFAELVSRTPEPFVQAIVDLESPRMAWTRCCVIGDAAFVPRPHTAAGTAKAAGDVLALAAALREHNDVAAALRHWEPGRLAVGRELAERGRRLGRQVLAPKG